MIYLTIFLTFLEIGAVSFGGGYAMISMMRDKALHHGWLTEEELLNIIAVAESTPGPIAVNMATFVGAEQAGVLGALCGVLGVVLPSFLLILLIAAALPHLLKRRGVRAALQGIRPCTVGLILATGAIMLLSVLFSLTTIKGGLAVDLRGILILLCLSILAFFYTRLKKKKPSPILTILVAAGLGMLLY